ncbi:MAG TPA: AAA family ATPase [Geodermatophilus sp.]|nr:AAA family ATPase [Geodermatophilus sp.]
MGRGAETEVLTSLLDSIPSGGGALLLRGEPGIGKSRLLAAATALARERRIAVLTTTGVQSEAHLPFSGLHQLLRPVRARSAGLPPVLRDALDTAFGLTDGAAPERFRIALAALDMLSDVAGETPLLVVAEDAQWLDRATADTLAFVARRLEYDPIVLLAAVRDGYRSALTDAGLPELRIGALEPGAAAELLHASGQLLPLEARDRVLREAAGNPLALLELPVTGPRRRPGAPMPGLRPLTERLEQAFAARVSDLAGETRLLLLAAALSDGDRVGEALHAGSAVAGTPLGLEALEPAVDAAVIDLDERRITFRHPLMRSAVVQSATAPQRRRVHEALSEVLHAEPDRRVWHRAALLTGVHEDVAAELEEAGRRARRRGAIGVAVSALRRSAELSDTANRGRRLLAAAQLAFELGQSDVVVPLLREAERLDPGPLERARATWVKEMADLRPFGDVTRARALIAAAEHAGEAGDRDLCIDLLWIVAQRMWWVDAGPDARRPLVEAARGLDAADDARVLAVLAFADPFGSTPEVVRRLRTAATERSDDAEVARHLGGASVVVGAFDTGSTALGVAVEGLRAQGRLGHLPRLLALQGMVAARLADWDIAIPAAEESRRLAGELGEPLWGAGAETVISVIAGMRGDEEEAEQASRRAERIARPLGARFMMCYAQFGRILAALGGARHADAYLLAERLFDPTDPAHHSVACWHIADLAEAALHVGRVDHARARLAQVEAAVGEHPGTWMELSLRHARAVLADDAEAAARFDEALGADLALWPFPHARILLAHGQWLRRRRRVAESRAPLRAARDAFDALGCVAWSAQARRELRASGESSRRRDPAARDRLTAQELQIARLAAQGLSNREIGQRLYLSHRTIGTHLYRTFPKLGITARGELASALEVTPPPVR